MWYVVSKGKEFFDLDLYYNENNDTSLSLVSIKNGFRTAAKAKKRANGMAKRVKNGRQYDIVYKEEE
jgi:hypothetical protein